MKPLEPGSLTRAALGGLLLLAAGAAFPIDLLPDFHLFGNDEGKTVWEVGGQFVRIVPQDEAKTGRPPPNDHPVTLDGKQLREALGALRLWDRSGAGGAGAEGPPVFDASQLAVLETKLVEALARAGPGEDVTFAVMGRRASGLFAGERVVNSARAFFKDKRLHLIFGDLHEEVAVRNKRSVRYSDLATEEDRRLFPFTPGARRKAKAHDWRIAVMPGIEFYDEGGGARRDDWMVIDIPTVVAQLNAKAVPAPVAEEARKVREEAARLAAERRQMREEMARMRKELKERGGASSSVEERLATLDRLREKELISDEEYRRRRREILDDI